MVVIVMGVTGAGKTTVGRALARAVGWPFVEGDQLHPPRNVEKMRAGIPLTDEDRAPWLAAVEAVMGRALDRRENLVVACSALKERYRARLRGDRRGVRFVYLAVSEEVAVDRAAHRPGHFAGPALIPSQFGDLEPPTNAITIDAALPVDRMVAILRNELAL